MRNAAPLQSENNEIMPSAKEFTVKKFCMLPMLLVIAISAFTNDASAVQDEKEIREVYSELHDAMDDSDLESASKLMTKNALDEICADTLLMCIQIASEDMGMPEITDRLSDIVDEHGLDKVELPEALTNMESEEFPSEEEMAKVREDILKAVPAEKRIELVTEIKEATEEFMFGSNPFTGEIEELEIKDNGASVTVAFEEIEEMMEDAEMGGDFEIEMLPIVLKFKKVDDTWKWDGFDAEKTNALIDDVGPGPADEDADQEDDKKKRANE